MRRHQSGMTLVIALVMLVVLSLLVVSAIRFGNVNLKIAGNVQAETEAAAAAQVAVETTVALMVTTANIGTIAEKPEMVVSTGGQSYKVKVEKPACLYTSNIDSAKLDETKAADRVCFEGTDPDRQIRVDGSLSTAPSACKLQQWDVAASVDDPTSGAKVSMLQGVELRVGAEVQCP